MVGWIVNNCCPVWYSNRRVIREFWERFKRSAAKPGNKGATRSKRHKVYRGALRRHAENVDLVRTFRL